MNAGPENQQMDEAPTPQHDGDFGQDHRRLEKAGWEFVEKNSQKALWRNPTSGRLYPQAAAIKLVEEGQAPDHADDT